MKKLIRKIVYLTLGNLDRVLGRRSLITVLCYHAISPDNWFYSVSKENFAQQLKYLQAHYNLISLSELEKYLLGKKNITRPSVAITFDDGYRDVLSVTNLFKNLAKPTVFLISQPDEINRSRLGTNRQLLTKRDVAYLKKQGWKIGSHSSSHEDLTSSINIYHQTKKSADQNYFAFPWGKYNFDAITSVRSQGFKLGFSLDDAQITKTSFPYTIPRIGVNGTHSLSEFKYLNSPSVIQARRLMKNLGLKII